MILLSLYNRITSVNSRANSKTIRYGDKHAILWTVDDVPHWDSGAHETSEGFKALFIFDCSLFLALLRIKNKLKNKKINSPFRQL